MKPVSEIGDAMKKQAMDAAIAGIKLPELPISMQHDISKMIAGALMGQFGQLQIAIGKDGEEAGSRKVRLLIFPDEILSKMPELSKAAPVLPVQEPVVEVAPVTEEPKA